MSYFVAGYEYAYQLQGLPLGPSIQAHRWKLFSPLILDGKSVKDYAMFGEKHADHQATIGVMAHELAHLMFDLPDLYDRDQTSKGLGNWSLMASGSWNGTTNNEGDSPAHPDAWSKVQLGWVAPSLSTCPNISLSI